MDKWHLKDLAWRPHHPEILCSTEQGRAIVLDLPAGEALQDHQVHEGGFGLPLSTVRCGSATTLLRQLMWRPERWCSSRPESATKSMPSQTHVSCCFSLLGPAPAIRER